MHVAAVLTGSMLSTVAAVVPVFGLIFVGWVARRFGALGAGASGELNRFVVMLALPALLFDVVAQARWAELWQPGFIAAFGGSAAVVLAGTVAVRARRQPLADAAIEGLNAGYANTGFIGFPLLLAALGREAMAPTMIATIITACVLFSVGIVLIEIGLQVQTRRWRLGLKVGRLLAVNPLLIAPAAAALLPAVGVGWPAPVESFARLLGGAASPCALVALGLFLAEERPAGHGAGLMAVLVGLKLVVQPAVAWVLASVVFGLAPAAVHAAVLLAALPTGTGPFMLAEFYGRDARTTSGVVLVSTVVSVVTISVYLARAGR